jgi:cytidine deaminase
MRNPDRKQHLIEAALQARQHAYAPYSDYHAGIALLPHSFGPINLKNSGA